MESWYKKLGYYQNPFLINPMKESNAFIGQQQHLNDALYYITAGSLLVIEGESGSGKTRFLRKIIDDFKGRIIYVNARKLTKTLDMEELLRKKNGLSGKLLGNKPKGMILLIDNAEELSEVNIERLKHYFDQGYLQSIVFTTTKMSECAFSDSMYNRIGRRVIRIDKLDENTAIDIAFERLDEDKDDEDALISPKIVKEIFKKSDKNMKRFLINLHRVFEKMFEDDKETVEEKHIKIIDTKLSNKEQEELETNISTEKTTVEKELFDEHGNKIVKVGKYYRRPAHEMFCSNCGAIVSEDDNECPECHAEFEEEK
ncbi:MAG: P-loop NTPase fold protein [Nanobdellota archaeon]